MMTTQTTPAFALAHVHEDLGGDGSAVLCAKTARRDSDAHEDVSVARSLGRWSLWGSRRCGQRAPAPREELGEEGRAAREEEDEAHLAIE
ncbi:hypothetical protein SAMD00023353_0800070 [Rosellinia necatrix]|uniref:Uncharacterized protein n=1 Tax=Rosellinia necatrix TaxID=77044 RepID=A0A1S8A615_ROSNE|nr:hypothetical protein SAMD00023353_0800070 [Rosellinia necatrix]